ncbi:MAG: ABC-F family ATP-binding cassette domain-containing protein [Breznakia sp.]
MRYQISKGYKAFGAQDVLDNITFEVKDKERIAIVGRNGCGKSTLLKIIAETESLDKGVIHKDKNISIGYLAQTTFFSENHSVEEEFEQLFGRLHENEQKLQDLSVQMQQDTSEEVLHLYGKLLQEHERLGGYTYKNEIHTIFTKFGFAMEDLQKQVNEFSGGQKTRLAFVKLLLSKPDILLLDEPTNHLDIDTIKWLETYVKRYPKAVVLVSHDRTFLDEIANIIYEIEFSKIQKYVGNYSHFVEMKKQEIEKHRSAYRRQQEEIKKTEDLIERFRYKSSKAKMVQSKLKSLDKIVRIEKKKIDEKTFHASFKSRIKGGKQVLQVKDLRIGYETSLCTINLEVLRGQRIAIMGENGSGKSTFLKTLMAELKPLSGSFMLGHQVECGYFDQEHAQFNTNETVLETIWNAYPHLHRSEVRSALGAFLFQGDEVLKDVQVLSGGEKVRLAFVDLMLQQANFLLLDEPTNHLDILGKEALEESLLNYDGTMLFVSHDRYFISKIANGILEIKDHQAIYHPLSYHELKQKEQNHTQEKLQTKSKPRNINYGKEVSKLESKIHTCEKKMASLRELRFEPEYYHDHKKMEVLDMQIDDLHMEISKLMKLWEEYSEHME